jgi:hypothetical protein
MRIAQRHRPRINERLTAWTAIFALVVEVVLLSIVVVVAKADTSGDPSPVGLVICTAAGLERIARADQGTEPEAPVPSIQSPCLICLAGHNPVLVPSAAGEAIEHVVAGSFEGCATMPRASSRVAEPPPARGPPRSA